MLPVCGTAYSCLYLINHSQTEFVDLTTEKGSDDRLGSITHFPNGLISLAYYCLECRTFKKWFLGFLLKHLLYILYFPFVLWGNKTLVFLQYHFYCIIIFKYFIKAKALFSYTKYDDSQLTMVEFGSLHITMVQKLWGIVATTFNLSTREAREDKSIRVWCRLVYITIFRLAKAP